VPVPATHIYPSPLRYPGGKGKVANFIKLLLLENDRVGCEYIEPYAGGASVALSLLFEEYASHIHINDLNRSIHAFWKMVLEQPEELCSRIAKVPVTTEEWYRQRAVQGADAVDDLDLAFSTFFLNRTSRSGILTGGIIGGRLQTGQWKIDARYDKDDLILRIRRIARFKTRITVTGLDTAEYLKHRMPEVESPFLYLDPPYYAKGSLLYENFYRHDDHVEIATLVKDLEVPWVISYDAAPEIVEMYRGFSSISYDLAYSAGTRQRGSEIMFFSDRLSAPRVASPSNVPGRFVDGARIDALT
jgi:DNA adenine methylase